MQPQTVHRPIPTVPYDARVPGSAPDGAAGTTHGLWVAHGHHVAAQVPATANRATRKTRTFGVSAEVLGL